MTTKLDANLILNKFKRQSTKVLDPDFEGFDVINYNEQTKQDKNNTQNQNGAQHSIKRVQDILGRPRSSMETAKSNYYVSASSKKFKPQLFIDPSYMSTQDLKKQVTRKKSIYSSQQTQKQKQNQRKKKCEEHDDKKKITMDDVQIQPFKFSHIKAGMHLPNTIEFDQDESISQFLLSVNQYSNLNDFLNGKKNGKGNLDYEQLDQIIEENHIDRDSRNLKRLNSSYSYSQKFSSVFMTKEESKQSELFSSIQMQDHIFNNLGIMRDIHTNEEKIVEFVRRKSCVCSHCDRDYDPSKKQRIGDMIVLDDEKDQIQNYQNKMRFQKQDQARISRALKLQQSMGIQTKKKLINFSKRRETIAVQHQPIFRKQFGSNMTLGTESTEKESSRILNINSKQQQQETENNQKNESSSDNEKSEKPKVNTVKAQFDRKLGLDLQNKMQTCKVYLTSSKDYQEALKLQKQELKDYIQMTASSSPFKPRPISNQCTNRPNSQLSESNLLQLKLKSINADHSTQQGDQIMHQYSQKQQSRIGTANSDFKPLIRGRTYLKKLQEEEGKFLKRKEVAIKHQKFPIEIIYNLLYLQNKRLLIIWRNNHQERNQVYQQIDLQRHQIFQSTK
eukprot:403364003